MHRPIGKVDVVVETIDAASQASLAAIDKVDAIVLDVETDQVARCPTPPLSDPSEIQIKIFKLISTTVNSSNRRQQVYKLHDK